MAETRNIWNVVHCGIGFFLVFISFGTCQNIVVEAFDQKHYNSLGFYTVALIYVFYAITSLTFPFLVEKLGAVRSMSVGSFCYFVWVISGILPVWIEKTPMVETVCKNIITGCINGMGASLLWIGQGKYVSQCCTEENKGFYFSIVWLLFSLSSLLGSLFASFVLRITSQANLFIFMSIMSFLGSICLGFLRKPQDVSHKSSIDALLAEGRQAAISSPNANSEISLKSTFKLLVSLKMLKITGLMLNSGLICGIIAGFLPKVVANVYYKTQYINAFLFGALIVSVNTHLGSIAGSEFENTTEAYGCNSFSQSYIVFFLLIFESLIKNSDQLIEQRIFIVFYGFFGVASSLIALTFPFKAKASKLSDINFDKIELADDSK